MRKVVGILLVVFLVALAIGVSTPNVDASSCYFKCSCTGTPLKCCVNNGVETCKVAFGFYCPQIITC